MKSQVLHTVWCFISGEAAGKIWCWSLSGMKGLNRKCFALVAGVVHQGEARVVQVNLLAAPSSPRTSWRASCLCSGTSSLPGHSHCSAGSSRLSWSFHTVCTTRRLCRSQHSSHHSSDHYPCPWWWTSFRCEASTSLPPNLNTSPRSACTATAHPQRRNCHIWHTRCLRSSPLSPLVTRSVCWPSSDGCCQVPARSCRSAFQRPPCTHSIPGRNLGSRLSFSGTLSTPLRLWSCRSKLRNSLCRLDR